MLNEAAGEILSPTSNKVALRLPRFLECRHHSLASVQRSAQAVHLQDFPEHFTG